MPLLSYNELTSLSRLNLSQKRIKTALKILTQAVESGLIPGFVTLIGRRRHPAFIAYMGDRVPMDHGSPLSDDTIFLTASLTKPVVCAAAMLLLQDGRIHLDQPVVSILPQFGTKGKDKVLIYHLFTHTSGLEDQVADNLVLRKRKAPLSDFFNSVCQSDLLFEPGHHIRYQSMGILTLGQILEKVTGMHLKDFLVEKLFIPLGMKDSCLGLPSCCEERLARILMPDNLSGQEYAECDWNSLYWRSMGVPWGGLHSTVWDLSSFIRHVMVDEKGPLTTSGRRKMIADHTSFFPYIPKEEKLENRWGLGWMLAVRYFGDLVSSQTFGHVGASGTLFWADPVSGIYCILLTNQFRLYSDKPGKAGSIFPLYSNAVAAAANDEG